MGDTLEQKKAKRLTFLHALYETSGGDEDKHLNMWNIAEEIGMSRDDAELVAQYLKGEHLIEFVTMGGYIAITHFGVIEVERALSEPEEPTQYFPPVINVLHIGSVQGSSIQQTGSHSTVSAQVSGADTQSLREIVSNLRTSLDELGKSVGNLAELQAMVTTLEAQVGMHSPNRNIVIEALKSVRTILEGASGNVLATAALEQIRHWLG